MSTGDQFRSNVVLHTHADGINGSTTLTDTSASGHTFTANGNAQLSTSRPKFGTAAMEFDGAGDHFQSGNSSDFAFGSGDFTIEGWFQTDTVSGLHALIGYANGSASNSNYEFQLLINGTSLNFSCFNGTTQYNATKTGVSAGVTHSWCLERYGTNIYAYLDGVPGTGVAVSTNSFNNPASAVLQIGRVQGSFDWDGMIDELRITKGVARYKGTSYTPDTSAFADVGLVATGVASTLALGTPVGTGNITVQATGRASTLAVGTIQAVYSQTEQASDIASTLALGTPVGKPVFVVTGLASTLAVGTPQNIPNARGVASTLALGTPSLALKAGGIASSLAVGSPRLVSITVADGIESTLELGTPWTPTNRTYELDGIEPLVEVGLPTSLDYLPVKVVCVATGIDLLSFGTPTTKQVETCVPDGIASGIVFGVATAVNLNTLMPDGIAPAITFGVATAGQRQRATGAKTTAFGTPTIRSTTSAVGIASTLRYGTPAQWGEHMVTPMNALARVGHPRAIADPRIASGIGPLIALGDPGAVFSYRASAIPRGVRIGKPLIIRTPSC